MTEHNQSKRRWSRTQIALLVLIISVGIILLARMLLALAIERVFSNLVNGDCSWTGTAHAWVDDDGDGIREADERRLAGVQFFVDDVKNNFRQVGSGISDVSGNAELYIFVAGCPDTKMEVYPEVPENYCLTTPERMDGERRGPYAFGFTAC